ncbi:hypothetical protein N431DRAFT_330326 [Stipitochalara longipes BDJ]|nr:hypothetical protein N431DRAFT_330326 [Stipitochalara longipes BDJ]
MTIQDESKYGSYISFLQNLAKLSSNYKSFNKFFKENHDEYESPAKFTLFSIKPASNQPQNFDIREFEGTAQLADELEAIVDSEGTCRLFLVENVCLQTVSLFGEHFNIDPQFFADHFNVESWYRIGEDSQLLALPSSQKSQDFLTLRFIETQTILKAQPSSNIGQDLRANKASLGKQENDVVLVPDDAVSFILPDKTTARVRRKAGRLTPRPRASHSFHPLLLARQAITVWFQEHDNGGQGWTGIVLVDPPFQDSPGDTYCEPAERRSFGRRPNWKEKIGDIMPLSPIRAAIAQHLQERLACDPSLVNAARGNCFLLLGEVYRIVASNWIVLDQYINRELATVENILEKDEPGFRQLETYLKEMYMHRRRCTKYFELIGEARQQCHSRGQSSWPKTYDQDSEAVDQLAEDLEQDFIYLQTKTQGTAQRTEKNIQLLTALVSIVEGKQALDENHGIGRLTLLAMVFLPFSTVGTILGIQTIYGPGQDAFWLFWAVSIPLTGFILIATFLFNKLGDSFVPSPK